MSDEPRELQSLLEELQAENAELKRRNSELQQEMDTQLSQLQRENDKATAAVEHLSQQLEDGKVVAELERLREMEDLRREHQRALRREQDLTDYERDRAKSLAEEKAALEEKVRALSRELEMCRAATTPAPVSE